MRWIPLRPTSTSLPQGIDSTEGRGGISSSNNNRNSRSFLFGGFCNEEYGLFQPEIAPQKVEEDVVHEENNWGISLVSEDAENTSESTREDVVAGVYHAYERPKETGLTPEADPSDASKVEQSLDELMKQMQSLWVSIVYTMSCFGYVFCFYFKYMIIPIFFSSLEI